MLVAVGAAAFVDLAMHLTGADGAVRVIAYVVSGIGFLGAGVIMKQGMDVRGLNTAATLWASAAVGSCAGADMIAQAAALTVFVLAGNTCCARWSTPSTAFRSTSGPRRRPIISSSRSRRTPCPTCATAWSSSWKLPNIRSRISTSSNIGDDLLEIVATLVPTAVDPNELNAVALDLQQQPGVRHATWEVNTTD